MTADVVSVEAEFVSDKGGLYAGDFAPHLPRVGTPRRHHAREDSWASADGVQRCRNKRPSRPLESERHAGGRVSDVGRYRKLYARVWRHPGFTALTDGEKTLALYLLTGPQTNRLGLYTLSVATAAEHLGTVPETIPRARDGSE